METQKQINARKRYEKYSLEDGTGGSLVERAALSSVSRTMGTLQGVSLQKERGLKRLGVVTQSTK